MAPSGTFPSAEGNVKSKKSRIVHRIVYFSKSTFSSRCGLTWPHFINTRFFDKTNEKVTCKSCLKAIKAKRKSEEAQEANTKREKLNIKVIKSFQTSDGMIFDKESKAFDHEEHLKSKRLEAIFATYVRKELDDSMTAEKEEEIIEGICMDMPLIGEVISSIDDLSILLWELFSKYDGLVSEALKKFKALKGE